MSYSVDHPTLLELISKGTNALVAVLSLFIIPYVLYVGWFWGAPLLGLVIQLVWLSALPVASIPISARAARNLKDANRTAKANAVRFLPLLTFFIIGPALAYLTKIIGMMIMGR